MTNETKIAHVLVLPTTKAREFLLALGRTSVATHFKLEQQQDLIRLIGNRQLAGYSDSVAAISSAREKWLGARLITLLDTENQQVIDQMPFTLIVALDETSATVFDVGQMCYERSY